MKIKQIFALTLSICLLMVYTPIEAETIHLSTEDIIVQEQKSSFLQIEDLPSNIKNLLPNQNDNSIVYLTSSENQNSDESELYTIRTENPQTGEGTLTLHSTPVKYIDPDGNLQFINTAIEPINNNQKSLSAYAYQNAANSFTVEYGATAATGINFNNDFTFAVKAIGTNNQAAAILSENENEKITYNNVFGTNTSVNISILKAE